MTSMMAGGDATYTIDIIPDTDIALFHWSGPITFEDRVNYLEMMSEFCRDRGVSKLIIDGRHQESKTGTVDSYEFGTRVPMAFRGLRVAVVHRPDDEMLKFIETVAFNRGSGTRAFQDFDEARAWLEAC